MPLQLPSLQPASGIQPVNAVPVELVYGPYSGADIASAKQAALDATVNRRYFGMMVGLNVNGVGFIYYFKDLNTLEPIGGGETGPQGFTGPQGQTGPAGAGAAATLVVPFGSAAGGIDVNQVSFQHVFGSKPLVQVYDVNGRNTPTINASINYIDVTDTQITVQFENFTSGYVVVGGGLSGPQGNTGPQGETGAQGPKGPTGDVLYTGQQGPTGIQGFTGPQGNTGIQGFTGPQGNTGVQGFTGPQGNTGVQGFTGPQGFTGNQGVTGPQGHTGVQGYTGPQGFTGPQGVTGPQGNTGVQGYTGPQGGTGADGAVVSIVQTIVQWTYAGIIPMTNVSGKFRTNSDQFNSAQQFQFHKNDIATVSYANWFDQLDTFVTNGNPSYLQVYDAITASNTGLYKVNSVVEGGFTYSIFVDTPSIVSNGSFNIGSVYNVTWVANGTIGATGASGLQGFTGPQGFTGNQGTTGPQGRTGPQGFTGPQGSTGVQGFTGPQGVTGPQGFTGNQGFTGPQGVTGPQGFTGPQGSTGADGSNLTGTGPVGYLPIYTQNNTKLLGSSVTFSSNPGYTSSVYLEATPAGYNSGRSYRIPALQTNVGTGVANAPIGDFILNTGDQNIVGVKSFRYGHNTSTAVNLDGTWGSVILTELLYIRAMPTFLGSNTSANFQGANYRVQKSWVSAFNGTDGGVNTSRGNITGGPNNSSILNRIIRKTSSNRAFAKTIYTDEIDYYNYGKTTSNVGSSWGNENLRTKLTDWNQVIGRNTTTLITNDVDPYTTVGFSYSQGDPDHIENFVFNMHVSRMKSATNSTQVDTLLHHWLRGESGFQELTAKKAFYSFTQSTLLFVNPQVGGVNAPNDFATVSSSVGVYTRHDVDSGQIINAYDYFSSRVGNGTVNSKILNHVGYFAQSKTRGTASFDPSGRRTYSFKNGPELWPATYSYQQAPWAFYAEDDKSNLGGGLLINMGATFGTQLNAWLEIQGATASKAQIRLNPATGPASPGQGDMWFTGDNLYFYDGSTQYDLITSQNAGVKGKLGVYAVNGTKLDDEISWTVTGGVGTVSIEIEQITISQSLSYTIPSNNKSQDFVMTEGNQLIKGFKRFEDQQISFGPQTASSTITVQESMDYGTISTSGEIRNSIYVTGSFYGSSNTMKTYGTNSQTRNLKQEIIWKNSLGIVADYNVQLEGASYQNGIPNLINDGEGYNAGDKETSSRHYLIDPRYTGNSYYSGNPIINITQWSNFISSPGLTFGSGDYLSSLNRGFTNSNKSDHYGILVAKGSSIQHHQWEDIGHIADIVNFEYTENGGFPYADDGSAYASGRRLGFGRVRSKNTVHHYLKTITSMDSPGDGPGTASRFNQTAHTNLFIESVGNGNPSYSFGVYYKSFGPHGRYSYDFYSAKPDNFYYKENTGQGTKYATSSIVGFYAQDKVNDIGMIDPIGRNFDFNSQDAYRNSSLSSVLYYRPWSFFAESDKANFGGGVLLMGTNSSIVRGVTSSPVYSDILEVYRTGLPAWLTIQEGTTDKSQIRFVTGSVTPTTPVSGDMWYTGTALNFVSEGTTYDLLLGGAGGNGAQGPTGPSGVNRSDTFSATTSFTVTHNFNTIPVVEVVSGTAFPFDVIIPQSIVHASLNQYTVTFAATSSGRILTGIGQNGNAGGQGVKGDTGPQGPTGPSELTPIGGPTGSILVRYASGWTAFSATTSTDVYLKSNGYNLPIWATVSGGGGSGDVSTGNYRRLPIYSTDSTGTSLADTVDGTTIQLADQSGTKTYTIPNSPSSASFVMTEGTQTIGGTKSFTNQVKVTSNGLDNAQILIDGTNANWINFGNLGFGNPVTSGTRPAGTKLLLVDDTTSSAAIGVQQKTTTDTRLWLQGGLAGSVDFYTDNIRVGRIDSATLSLYGRALSFGSPTSSSNFGGRSLTLVMENETLTSNRTITVPVSDQNDLVIVQKLNPGLTGSETGKAAMVLDAYGSVTRGGEIIGLGVYSMTTTKTINSNGPTAMSGGTIVPTGGKIIPANWWGVGKVVTGKLIGTILKNNSDEVTFSLRYGSSILVSLNTINFGTSSDINSFEINWTITCRSVGGSGSFQCFIKLEEYLDGGVGGYVLDNTTPLTGLGNGQYVKKATATGISTTSDKELDVFVDISGGPSIAYINVDQVIVEYKN
jgi:hypothetical protein